MLTVYTRDSFNRQRARAKAVSDAAGRVLAIVAVGLGVGQLVLFRLVDSRITPAKKIPFELSLFLAYIALVGYLLWRMNRVMKAEAIRCPQCRKELKAGADDVAGATGKCTFCGGQVIA